MAQVFSRCEVLGGLGARYESKPVSLLLATFILLIGSLALLLGNFCIDTSSAGRYCTRLSGLYWYALVVAGLSLVAYFAIPARRSCVQAHGICLFGCSGFNLVMQLITLCCCCACAPWWVAAALSSMFSIPAVFGRSGSASEQQQPQPGQMQRPLPIVTVPQMLPSAAPGMFIQYAPYFIRCNADGATDGPRV